MSSQTITDTASMSLQIMRSEEIPDCYLCAAPGAPMFTGLPDRLYDAAGEWNLLRCKNPDCGLIWMSPMPIPQDINLAYQNYYTHATVNTTVSILYRIIKTGTAHYVAGKYGYRSDNGIAGLLASLLVRLDPGWRANADFSVFYLPAQDGGRLLEIGCGSGVMLENMQERGWDVTGVEIDPMAVAHARSRGLDVREGSLPSQSFEENSFNVVTMSHVIEHLHDPRTILVECLRILRPGGRLVLVTPNTEALSLSLFGPNWMHLDPPRHLHLFNRKGLTRLVSETGFEQIEGHTVPRDAKGNYAISMMIRRRGHWRPGTRLPLTARLAGRLLELAEWLVMKLYPHMGTELIVVGRKP